MPLIESGFSCLVQIQLKVPAGVSQPMIAEWAAGVVSLSLGGIVNHMRTNIQIVEPTLPQPPKIVQ
jgi:hypothetical protein